MRERKKELVGRVVSDKMQKTVVVAVQTLRRHPLYQRTMRRTKKYMAHNEHDQASFGDLVRIRESRPISRHKHWQVITILEKAAERGKAVILPEASAADMAALVLAGAGQSTDDVDDATVDDATTESATEDAAAADAGEGEEAQPR